MKKLEVTSEEELHKKRADVVKNHLNTCKGLEKITDVDDLRDICNILNIEQVGQNQMVRLKEHT